MVRDYAGLAVLVLQVILGTVNPSHWPIFPYIKNCHEADVPAFLRYGNETNDLGAVGTVWWARCHLPSRSWHCVSKGWEKDGRNF